MDKQLCYGRVEIIESTVARIHVRWSYQSCDFNYKVWGDSATEDYYFYRDGFGSRVVTLTSAPDTDYELSDFILLTAQATYPFSVLPPNLVDALFLDGQKREFRFPLLDPPEAAIRQSRGIPAIYRIRLNKHNALGRQRRMLVQRWAWLIGMSDASDQRLREWAWSFSRPPSIHVQGGRCVARIPERRALRIAMETTPLSRLSRGRRGALWCCPRERTCSSPY